MNGDRSHAPGNVCPEAFMEELCSGSGGYSRFFRSLVFLYIGWWVAVAAVLTLFVDHHRCEAHLPAHAWLLYTLLLTVMVVVAVLLELEMVKRLGLYKAGGLPETYSKRQWQVLLISTVLWKFDVYMDVGFIMVARDCGSSLWQASFAAVIFGVVLGQLCLNIGFAVTDCDHELPASLGFFLLDFKFVNTAVFNVLPFDPDFSHLPVARQVTLRTTRQYVSLEKVATDLVQVSIQVVFLQSIHKAQGFVILSIIIGILHGALSVFFAIRDYVQDEWDIQSRQAQLGSILMAVDPKNRRPSISDLTMLSQEDDLEKPDLDRAVDVRSSTIAQTDFNVDRLSSLAARPPAPEPMQIGASAIESNEEDSELGTRHLDIGASAFEPVEIPDLL